MQPTISAMAKDLFHETVKLALQKDGWMITHDPLPLLDKARNIDYEIDLGAEKLIGAERGQEKIAIEVKNFLRASFFVMESLKNTSQIIQTLLNEYDPQTPDSYIVADTHNHHYQIVCADWDLRNRYYYRVRMHLHIQTDGKICILENRTDFDIAADLIARGVPAQDIILNFIPASVRALAGYA